MAVMRAKHGVRPLHEPSLRPRPRSRTRPRPANLVSRTRTRTIGFMVPMRDSGIVEALHELSIGARTAMSARIKSEELADKAVRAPVRRRFTRLRSCVSDG